MKKVAIIIQARMGSKRLPRKVLKKLSGKPMLEHLIDRLKLCKETDHLMVATSKNPENAPVEILCAQLKVSCFRGAEEDVLDRYIQAAKRVEPDLIVRVTGDCPLVDPEIIDECIRNAKKWDSDLYRAGVSGGFPRGLDCEIVKTDVLKEIYKLDKSSSSKEHVTWGIYHLPDIFKIHSFKAPASYHYPQFRLCVDEAKDFELISKIYSELYRGDPIQIKDVFKLLLSNQDLANINQDVLQKHV